jgi:hypothetical protein
MRARRAGEVPREWKTGSFGMRSSFLAGCFDDSSRA